MSGRIRYRCNACGETFDLSSIPQESAVICPACRSDDLIHVADVRPLDFLRDRFGDSTLLKLLRGALLILAILFSIFLLLAVICFTF